MLSPTPSNHHGRAEDSVCADSASAPQILGQRVELDIDQANSEGRVVQQVSFEDLVRRICVPS